jgi:hypothetical protein
LDASETTQDAGITAVAMDGHPFVPAWLLAERGLLGSGGKEHSTGGVSRQQSLWICRSGLTTPARRPQLQRAYIGT